jgi:hypothetical protein
MHYTEYCIYSLMTAPRCEWLRLVRRPFGELGCWGHPDIEQSLSATYVARMKTSGFSETPENSLTRTQCHQPGMKSRNCREISKINEGNPVILRS